MFHIIVAEDETLLNQLICKNLEKAGYNPIPVFDGVQGLKAFETNKVDLVISDIMMPHVDGISFVKQVRSTNNDIPILLLTALDTFMDKEKGFMSGADDYLVKPVEMKELLLHVKALLRRYKIVSESKFKHKSLELDFTSQSLSINGNRIDLTTKEFQLLFKLVASQGQIFTREQLMDDIWGYDSESYERTVDTHIKRLRTKVQTDDMEIITVRGLGYKVILK
jgi:DNA-binding response OmpR family regulator